MIKEKYKEKKTSMSQFVKSDHRTTPSYPTTSKSSSMYIRGFFTWSSWSSWGRPAEPSLWSHVIHTLLWVSNQIHWKLSKAEEAEVCFILLWTKLLKSLKRDTLNIQGFRIDFHWLYYPIRQKWMLCFNVSLNSVVVYFHLLRAAGCKCQSYIPHRGGEDGTEL